MTTLVLAGLALALSPDVPHPVELRLKWMLGSHDEWQRWLVWRDGNTEYPIMPLADFDLTRAEAERTRSK